MNGNYNLMEIALINSRQDKAGVNIRHHIEEMLGTGKWQGQARTYEFIEVTERIIHAEHVDRQTNADLVIFLSRHSSVNPVPVLTVHVTGNFGTAEVGGTPRTLAPAATAMMQATLRMLAKHCPEGYRASYEVTHHGPTGLSLPSFFVEIGSTEKEWTDQEAGKAVAESVLSAYPTNPVPLIGFGGTHYAARETEIALTSRGAFGHIAHTREIALLDEELVRAMMVKSGAVAAYIDRKALDRENLNNLSSILKRLSILRLSESEIMAIGHVPWDTYLNVRKMAEQVSPDTRCYIHDLQGEGALCTVRIDPVLLGETVKSGEPELIKNLEKLPLVHLSTQDNRLLPEFITYESHSSQIINDLNTLCVKIIRSNEITVTEKDTLILRKIRFDPHKARELGVPPGPSYKHLAEGQEVTVDGRVIMPAMVSSCSEIKIHIPGLEKYP
jgi:D-aminoacyl-tRNA deacylase